VLAVPAGFDAPRLLRYDGVTAHAITRDDLGADVRSKEPAAARSSIAPPSDHEISWRAE
jgi:hypothetical protein